jgi:hypothetical protein
MAICVSACLSCSHHAWSSACSGELLHRARTLGCERRTRHQVDACELTRIDQYGCRATRFACRFDLLIALGLPVYFISSLLLRMTSIASDVTSTDVYAQNRQASSDLLSDSQLTTEPYVCFNHFTLMMLANYFAILMSAIVVSRIAVTTMDESRRIGL